MDELFTMMSDKVVELEKKQGLDRIRIRSLLPKFPTWRLSSRI